MTMTLLSILALLVGFGFLIFVHELGHFLVAKAVGIRVTQFAIGFGPSLLTWRKGLGFRTGTTEPEYEKRIAEGADPASMSETEYRLNYLAVLGGYVKMLGQEDLDPNAQSSDPRAYNNKSISARAAVISAGVVMNVIFGLILFVIAFMAGVQFPPAVVGGVMPDTPAAETYAQNHEGEPQYRGLEIGDRVTHINGDAIRDMMELSLAVTLGRQGRAIELTVEREGYQQPLHYVMTAEPGLPDGRLSLGIAPPQDIKRVIDDSARSLASERGIVEEMGVVSIDGEPIDSYGQYRRALIGARGEPVDVTFARRRGADEPRRGGSVTVAMSAMPDMTATGLEPAVVIDAVMKRSPAEDSGIMPGDVLAAVNAVSWPTLTEVSGAIREAAAAEEVVSMTVYRDGELVSLEPIRPSRQGQIGIRMGLANEGALIARTAADSPMSQFALPRGSRVTTVEGEPVESWSQAMAIMQHAALAGQAGEAVEVQMTLTLNLPEHPQEQVTLSFSGEQASELAAASWYVPGWIQFDMLREPVVAANPWQATVLGVEKTGQFVTMTYVALLRLFEGSVKPDHLRGPVGIVDEGAKITQYGGWTYLLFFLGLISVNLAVINFLPIPIVDGGHMVFLLIEKIKGSPPSATVQAAALYLGLAFIIGVFVMVTYNDIVRLFTS